MYFVRHHPADGPMPTARKLLAGLALAMMAVSCSEDKNPTAPATTDNQTPPSAAVTQSKALLTDRAVTGTTTLISHPSTAGPAFSGFVTITKNGCRPHHWWITGQRYS